MAEDLLSNSSERPGKKSYEVVEEKEFRTVFGSREHMEIENERKSANEQK